MSTVLTHIPYPLILSALSAVLLGSAPLHAQQEPALGQLVERVDDGIADLQEMQDGTLWIGTDGAGLYRWDGKQLRRFTKEDGLSSNALRDLAADSKGRLLATTVDAVHLFDGSRFSTLEFADPQEDGANQPLNPDHTWFSFDAGSNGAVRFDGEKLHRLKLSGSPADGVKKVGTPNWRYSPYGVYSVSVDARGHVWIGTAEYGVCRFDGKSQQWYFETRLSTTPSGGESGVRAVFQDRKGDYWISNTRNRFSPASGPPKPGLLPILAHPGLPEADTDDGENFGYFHSVDEDADGNLWFACGSLGILKYDGEKVTPYPLGADGYARAVLVDQSGTVWGGTWKSGLYRLQGDSFSPFRPVSAEK